MEKKLIKVRVIPKARINKVKEEGNNYKIYTTVAPEKDKANKAIINLLAEFFQIRPSAISIISGRHSKNKTLQINS